MKVKKQNISIIKFLLISETKFNKKLQIFVFIFQSLCFHGFEEYGRSSNYFKTIISNTKTIRQEHKI